MMPLLSLLAPLKRPRVLLLVGLVLAVSGYLAWSEINRSSLRADVAELRSEVTELESKLTLREGEVRNLTASIEDQNAEVERWRTAAATRAQAAQEAMDEARAATRAADEAIGRLRARDAQTCQEAMGLIDEELDL